MDLLWLVNHSSLFQVGRTTIMKWIPNPRLTTELAGPPMVDSGPIYKKVFMSFSGYIFLSPYTSWRKSKVS